MFDSTNVHVGGSSFNYNINAVSGTIRKSHPKSQIIIRDLKYNTKEFDVSNPSVWIGGYSTEEIVVLQVMLIGNNQGLIEIVRKKDFTEDWQ
jgi:hypothetical protein